MAYTQNAWSATNLEDSATSLSFLKRLENAVAAIKARQDQQLASIGLISQSFDLNAAAASVITMTSQQVLASLLGLRQGDVVTNIVLDLETVASGTNPTNIFVGLYNSAGPTQLAVSSDQAASASFTTAIGKIAVPLTAPFTITADGGYYAALLINGTYGTTQPQFGKGNSNAGSGKALGTGAIAWGSQNAQTTLPGTLSLTGGGGQGNLWVGVS